MISISTVEHFSKEEGYYGFAMMWDTEWRILVILIWRWGVIIGSSETIKEIMETE